MESYEDTAFNKEDPQYSMQKLRSDSVRGFVFATMNADAPDLRTWMGGAADVMENLCDRAPDGEVEAAGGDYHSWICVERGALVVRHKEVTYSTSIVPSPALASVTNYIPTNRLQA